MFQAPVDRYMNGASGWLRRIRSVMTAMPGVGMRACSSRMKEFQAATMGRGSMVTMTVSSTSMMTPSFWLSGTM